MLLNRKFAAQAMVFLARVGVVAEGNIPLLRSQGLLRYVSDALFWFEQNPDLTVVKLVAVITSEVSVEQTVDVRLRHHVKVTGLGVALFEHEVEHDDYVMRHLPYQCMGAGVFELDRADELVQEYLSFIGSEDERYTAIVQTLADRMNLAIGSVQVTHDYGLKSAV